MTPEQCRAGRAWLNLTQAQFATAAGVSLSTLKDFEAGNRTPMAANLKAIQAALEAKGINLIEGGMTGPEMKKE